MKMHLAGKTDQAKADLARLAIIRKQREEAARKKEEEKKGKLEETDFLWNTIIINDVLYKAYNLRNAYCNVIVFIFVVFFIAAKEAAQAAAKGLHTLSLK